MKISMDGKLLFELSDIQKKVIQNDICSELFIDDMERRIKHAILLDKYGRAFERLKNHWAPILKERVDAIPTSDEALCELIFSQPDYKNRTQRDNEELIVKYQKIVAEHGQESADNYVNSAFNAERLTTIKSMLDSKEA